MKIKQWEEECLHVQFSGCEQNELFIGPNEVRATIPLKTEEGGEREQVLRVNFTILGITAIYLDDVLLFRRVWLKPTFPKW